MTDEEHAKFYETHCWGCGKDIVTGDEFCPQCDKENQAELEDEEDEE